MTAPLHERLEALAQTLRTQPGTEWWNTSAATCREAAAALRPPEGELGALCERLAAGAGDLRAYAGRTDDIGDHVGLHVAADDMDAALAYLRRL
jgi:hypothetical protein